MHSNFVRSLLVGFVVIATAWAPGAWAQDQEARMAKAKEHYELGRQYYGMGKYKEAIQELKAAYDLSGETTLLYNIAKSYEKLGDFDKAIQHYKDYLDLRLVIPAADRADVERAIAVLRKKKEELLPQLVIRSTPRGADIFIDTKTKLRGQTPDKFRLEPGPHTIYLEKKGFEAVEKSFVMPTGKPLILEFDLKPVEQRGNIQIIANVIGARVFIDGKNVGITPYREMPSVKVGTHQIILEKPGFFRWEKRIEVEPGRTALVEAKLVPKEKPSSAPAIIGWTSFVLGGLSLGGAAVAYHFAEQQFSDTEDFNTLHNLEFGGYVAGGVLMTLALTLITYDLVRDDPYDDMDENFTQHYSGLEPHGSWPVHPVVVVAPGLGTGLGLGASF